MKKHSPVPVVKENKFDAVKMVRELRDCMYEKTKDLTHQELIEYYNKKGKKLKHCNNNWPA
jgi:hypothetical protein